MGYKIKDYRESLGRTQDELAKKSGVSRGTLCALENGSEKVTTTKTLMKIASALDLTIDSLFYTESV